MAAFTRTHVAVMGMVIFLIAAGVAGFFIVKKSHVAESPLAMRRALPDITFKDVNGNIVAASSLIGRPIILDMWTSWCSLCIPHISHFGAVQKEFGDKVVIIEVNRGESLEVVKKYADKIDAGHNISFLLDANDSLYQAIEGFSMPETVFVDKDGNIVDHTRGTMDSVEIERRIQDSFAL